MHTKFLRLVPIINIFEIQINQPTRCNSFTSLLLDVYVWLNMFRAPPRPSSGAYNCTRSLWFYRWKVAVGALLAVGLDHSQQRYKVSTTRPTTFHVCKTRGYQCSFRLLMMGGVSPETCWASYKYGIIKVWYIVACCWIFLYEFYYDARIHERQALTKYLLQC